MSINKYLFTRITNITAKVICDSISEHGFRITTFELEYPRFIHSEFMTHRELSKNSSSSRAIPFAKMIENIENNMAKPVHWGKNRSGMQASNEEVERYVAEEAWDIAARSAIVSARNLSVEGIGLHKQIANRVTEPFSMIKVVMTTTSLDNLFNLRLDKDAQPEFVVLAKGMYEAFTKSNPKVLKAGQYHLPYVETIEVTGSNIIGNNDNQQHYFMPDGTGEVCLEDAIKISVASCAAVSYRTEGMTLEKADKIYNMLINAEVVHSSPFEHVATPIDKPCCAEGKQIDYETALERLEDEKGITHINKNLVFCSGNFTGWIQYRHLLDNNTCNNFDYNNRMKSF